MGRDKGWGWVKGQMLAGQVQASWWECFSQLWDNLAGLGWCNCLQQGITWWWKGIQGSKTDLASDENEMTCKASFAYVRLPGKKLRDVWLSFTLYWFPVSLLGRNCRCCCWGSREVAREEWVNRVWWRWRTLLASSSYPFWLERLPRKQSCRNCLGCFLGEYKLNFSQWVNASFWTKMIWHGDSGVGRIILLPSDSLVTDGPKLGQQGQKD